MMRPALASNLSFLLLTGAVALASPALAGMTQDLEDCTAADRKTSAAACTRVMDSGRLWDNQYYIGHYNRGWAYFNADDYDKALADFDKSVKLNASYADTYLSRAVTQHMKGARDAALTDLDTYLEKKGEIAEAHVNRARLFRSMKEPNRAFSELQRAGDLDPGDDKVEAMRALALADLGELGPARAAAEKAIASKPDDAGGYYARAFVSYAERRFPEARTDVEKALSIKDKFIAAHTLMGKLHEEQGEKDAAIASYRRATEGFPKAPDAISAKEEARERLAALNGDPAPAKVAASEPKDTPPPASTDCRRFIPQAGTTVAVDCTE
jgi:tetratricopeptide (TPR) repeat protein